MKKNKSLLETLYGGVNMSWGKVVALALGSAVLTAVFLIVPAFQNTSFQRMGVMLEAWIFFAVWIMANCKTPLESALKTFVFFLVSQPLIYLIQVPFSALGWSLFRFYKTWFLWTLLTFPMAYVGWFITRKNWLSLLILAPVLVFLGLTAYQTGAHALRHFPKLLVTCLFCLLQILLYGCVFLPGWKKALGLALAGGAVLATLLFSRPVEVNGTLFLPDDTALTDAAVLTMEEPAISVFSRPGSVR